MTLLFDFYSFSVAIAMNTKAIFDNVFKMSNGGKSIFQKETSTVNLKFCELLMVSRLNELKEAATPITFGVAAFS